MDVEARTSKDRLDLLAGGLSNDDDRATEPEEALAQEEDDQVAAASAASLGNTAAVHADVLFAHEQQLLDEMTEIADAARGLPDAKVQRLLDWITENMLDGRSGGHFAFSSSPSTTTPNATSGAASAALAHTERAGERIGIFHGPTPPEEREEIKQASTLHLSQTRCAFSLRPMRRARCLNLQAHCWHLFHFDVPWNPARMEQRNGRIDRKLQPSDEVFCHYFVYLQRPEDRVLQVLVRKTETIRKELGSLAQVVESRLETTMSRGIRHADVDVMRHEIEAADIEATAKATVQSELEDVAAAPARPPAAD